MDKQILNKIDNENLTEMDKLVINYLKKKKKIYNDNICPEPTKIKISTMTVKSGLNKRVNLDKLVELLLKEYIKHDDVYMLKGIEFKSEGNIINVGETKPKRKERDIKSKMKKIKRKKKTNIFCNQVTLIINPTGFKENRNVTMKLFKNGNITITGVKQKDDGLNSIKFIKEKINSFKKDVIINDDLSDIKITDFKIVLINSGFALNFSINREKLYFNLIKNNIFASYEPTKYAGVKVSYLYNENNKDNTGICLCKPKKCVIEFKKKINNKCKVVTIGIFEEGNIIITGGNCMEHINKGYEFINNFMKLNYKNIFALKIVE